MILVIVFIVIVGLAILFSLYRYYFGKGLYKGRTVELHIEGNRLFLKTKSANLSLEFTEITKVNVRLTDPVTFLASDYRGNTSHFVLETKSGDKYWIAQSVLAQDDNPAKLKESLVKSHWVSKGKYVDEFLDFLIKRNIKSSFALTGFWLKELFPSFLIIGLLALFFFVLIKLLESN